MSRVLVAASEHFLERTNGIVTDTPLTLACWYKPVSATATGVLLTQSTVDTTQNYFYLYHFSGNAVVAQAADATDAFFAVSSAGTSNGVWTHGCAVFAASNSRSAYINGGSKQTGTDALGTPSAPNRTLLGARYVAPSTKDLFFDGDIAEAAIWNIALSDSEVASLYVSPGVGIYPSDVRPDALVAYWRLLGDDSPEPDDVGSNDLTVTGATQGTHLTMQHLTGGGIVRQMMMHNEG